VSKRDYLNRCDECGKFKPWERLRLTRFIPDSEFGPEVNDYTCDDCKPESRPNRDKEPTQ
jgi:hypothetical protein